MSSWDPTWEEVFRRQEWGKYPPEYVIRFVARNWYKAPDRKAVRLLDVGSGPGANTWFMAREGFSVSAIDGAATGITQLHKRLAAEGLSVDARVGDFTQLPWADATFDGALDNVSLCTNHFEGMQRTVAEVHRVVKPGGLFLSANLSTATWGYRTGRELEPDGFVDIPAGPCAGKGFHLFLTRTRLDELYAPFSHKQIEVVSWSMDDMAHKVELWVVTCRK